MARQITTKKPRAIDITKPWKRKMFKCKNIDKDTLYKPFTRADFMRKPEFPRVKSPRDRHVNKNKVS